MGVQDDVQWVLKQLQNKALCSALLSQLKVPACSVSSLCHLFSQKPVQLQGAPSESSQVSLLLCRMFSKSVTLHLSPKHKIPSLRLERCVKAGKPRLDWFIKLKRRHLLPRLWAAAVFLGLCYSNPESTGSFTFTKSSVLSAHHLSNQGTRIF